MNKKRTIKLLMLIAVLILIFAFSSQPSSASTDLTNDVLMFLNFDLNKFFVPLRKSAHFLEYLVLGCVVFINIEEYTTISKKHVLLGILICFLYACTDEFHQLFVSGRSGQFKDVLIDTLGASSGTILSYFTYKKLVKKT